MDKECILSKIIRDNDYSIGEELILYIREREDSNQREIKFIEVQKTKEKDSLTNHHEKQGTININDTLLLSEKDFLKLATKKRYVVNVVDIQSTEIIKGMFHLLIKAKLEDV